MSDANDTRAPNNQLMAKEQASLEDVQELLRNFHHRVAMDGSKDFNALQYLQGIAANTAWSGIEPQATNVVTESDTDAHILVNCLPNERIYVFDILLSLKGVSDFSFIDNEGNDLLATMYAPNAGQGYSHNSYRGKPLPRGKGLLVQSSTAINYSIDCSFAIINDEAE